MTASVLTAPVSAQAAGGPSDPEPRAGLRWAWRLIRRGALLMWLATATYMSVEVVSYRTTYPDATSRAKLVELSDATAVRMLQGVPHGIDTAAGFAVWDGGWMLSLIIAVWAALTATRLTRGEEDSGRAELVLSRPITPRQSLHAVYGAMAIAVIGIGVAGALPFLVLGEAVAGALLWGLGLAAFGAGMGTVGALCAQAVAPRRRAVSLAMSAVAVSFLLRVVANSADARSWLLGFSPFGWLDRLEAFGGDRWTGLVAPVAFAIVVGIAALVLRDRRDLGAALVRTQETRRSRLRLLGGPLEFGWRLTTGALVAWTLTLAISSLVFGLMVGAVVDFITQDDTYRKLLESMGMDMTSPVTGFLSYMGLYLALPFAAFVAWRIGAARQEEADGRVENLLVRGVVRWRWLTGTTALALLAALAVVTASGAALWLGAHLADADVTLTQVVEPVAGTLPLVVLFTGLSVLAFGVAPRLTVALPVTLAVLGYLLDTFGTMLGWPAVVLWFSPYHHLARLPAHPMTLTAIGVTTGLGLCATAAGVVAFCRRDVQGA